MSSLAVGFSIDQNPGCGSLNFTDTTEYGTGGGSGELPSYADIGKTTIEFDFDNGESVVISNFIPTEENPSIEIFAGDLGYLDDNIPDQIVTITYTIYGTDGVTVLGTATSPVLFCCNFVACFYSNVKQVIAPCGCPKDKLLQLSALWVRFIGIQASVQCNACCASGDMEQLSLECSKFCITGGC